MEGINVERKKRAKCTIEADIDWGNWRTIKINYTKKKFKYNNGTDDDDDEEGSNLYFKIFDCLWDWESKINLKFFVIAEQKSSIEFLHYEKTWLSNQLSNHLHSKPSSNGDALLK